MPDLPNENRDKRFVATGPNQGFTVRGITGFYTEAALLAYGVNVQGNQCGVYGESVHTGPTDRKPELLPPDPHETNIGVCGVADHYGVFGVGFLEAGVYGESHFHGTGVFGVGKDDADGIVGLNKVKDPDHKTEANGAGIVGATESGKGFGVIGLSAASLLNAGPEHKPTLADGSGTGVQGRSGKGTGVHGASADGIGVSGTSSTKDGVFGQSTDPETEGAGVRGTSDNGIGVSGDSMRNDGVFGRSTTHFGVSGQSDALHGAGVFGISDQGYGGQFSGARAPLRLVPAKTVGAPRAGDHQIGEFFVDSNGDLFFCKVGGTPGTWFAIELEDD